MEISESFDLEDKYKAVITNKLNHHANARGQFKVHVWHYVL